MSVFKRLLYVFLALGIAAGSLTACNPTTSSLTTGVTTSQSLDNVQKILADVNSASENVKTVNFSGKGTLAVVTTRGTNDNILPVKMTLSGQLDVVNRAMQMAGEIRSSVPLAGEIAIPMDIYTVDGWIYAKVVMPGTTGNWTKWKLDDNVWQRQDQLKQQIRLLQTAANVSAGPDEIVNGTGCYVLTVNPNMTALLDWVVAQQQNSQLNLPAVNLTSAIKSFSVKEWIAKDTSLPVKTEITVSMVVLPEDVGVAAGTFDKVTLDVAMQQMFSDYNKAFTLQLPEGAKNARDLTPVAPTQK
jgi:hypothetical protein